MSNVLSRKRSLSELEFFKNAVDIRATFTRYVMNEKNIPKRWRPVFTFPGIDYVRKMMDEITAANTIYPYSEEELAQRRYHQTQAIIACEQTLQHIQWMVETLSISLKTLEVLCDMVFNEIALLKGWRKQNKVLNRKKTD